MLRWLLYQRGGDEHDPSYTWIGHAWQYGPPRWFARLWGALPSVLLALILWRVW